MLLVLGVDFREVQLLRAPKNPLRSVFYILSEGPTSYSSYIGLYVMEVTLMLPPMNHSSSYVFSDSSVRLTGLHIREEKKHTKNNQIRIHHPHLTVRMRPLCFQCRTTASQEIPRRVFSEFFPLCHLFLSSC